MLRSLRFGFVSLGGSALQRPPEVEAIIEFSMAKVGVARFHPAVDALRRFQHLLARTGRIPDRTSSSAALDSQTRSRRHTLEENVIIGARSLPRRLQ